MKPSLQLKIGQQLTMTPQLQQAIRLLQLSTLELSQEIQETLESNPMLEVEEPENDSQEDNRVSEKEVEWSDTDIPETLPVDSAWEDVYQSLPAAPTGADGEMSAFELASSASGGIQEHLHWQLNLTPMSDLDRIIAINLIDSVESDGYLGMDMDSMLASLNSNLEDFEEYAEFLPLEIEEIEAVLHRLQQFDPIGVCARDLQECLLIQLNQLSSDTPWIDQTRHIIKNFLPQLGNRDYSTILRRNRLKEDDLKAIIELIQTFNPRPGELIAESEAEYVIPDVIVTKDKARWKVELNPEVMPRLRVNSSYASLIKRADNSSDNNYLRNHLQEARWFLKSLQSRNETLLKVASKIVEIQQGFLEHGEEAMKPLVLHDIADAIDMHESTISRVTTQKYIHTPRGIFELKYFFSSQVSTETGTGCSSTAIRAIIKKLIAAEVPSKPLSDSKIADILSDQGINVARRTIAKYREALSIPPSNERKQLG